MHWCLRSLLRARYHLCYKSTGALEVLKGFYEKAALAGLGFKRQPAFEEFKRNEQQKQERSSGGDLFSMFSSYLLKNRKQIKRV